MNIIYMAAAVPPRKEIQENSHPKSGEDVKYLTAGCGKKSFPIAMTVLIFLLQIFISTQPAYCQEYEICDDFYLPFMTFQNRKSYSELIKRKLDGFGAYRRAGHKHAGLDIKAFFSEKVYPIGKGKVIKIYDKFPYQAVLVEHRSAAGLIYYSCYIHLVDILVKVGDRLDQATPIGRVFDENEFKKAGFAHNHLHLEIRKTIENYNRISIRCFTMEDLNKNFYDPLIFLKKHLGKQAG